MDKPIIINLFGMIYTVNPWLRQKEEATFSVGPCILAMRDEKEKFGNVVGPTPTFSPIRLTRRTRRVRPLIGR